MFTGQPAEKAEQASPRVLYLGTTGNLSPPPLEALLADGLPVCAVVLPASGGPTMLSGSIAGATPHPATGFTIRYGPPHAQSAGLPGPSPFMRRTIVQLAWERALPVVEVGTLADGPTLTALATFQPDVICVAGFPQRLPKALLALPPLGCLNLHPALLPAYRGPIPEFWVLRNGELYTGATVHLMDEHYDSGDVILQSRFEIPDDMPAWKLEQRCAAIGAPLMVQAVRMLASGTAIRIKQAPEQSSYYSLPEAEDFRVPVTRPARWAFNFIRGVVHWNGPLELHIGTERFRVRQAIEYQLDGQLDQPYRRDGSELWAQCTPGVLHVQLRE
jgi:methionyl-tRNA formyltransferase